MRSEAGEGDRAPLRDCPLCPRLVDYRRANQAANPEWFNAPVPCFGPIDARLAVVGMAPGVRGANRTGRPFTGDYAGMLLFETLLKFGLAQGHYEARVDDELTLVDTRIFNAVRCVPPANLPTPAEVRTCNHFLAAELASLPSVKIVLALGVVAHAAVVRAAGIPPSRIKFKHGQMITLPSGLVLANSYHVSRYNTNTGVLTREMFETVVAAIVGRLNPGRA